MVTVTNRCLLSLQRALNALDGRHVVEELMTSSGQLAKQQVVVPYAFSGATRMRLGKAMAAVNEALDVLAARELEIRRGLVPDGVPDGDTPEDRSTRTLFESTLQAAYDETVELDVPRFSIEALNLDVNPLPISVISLLSPFLLD